MRKLIVFNNISLDGYFTDANNDMSFAHREPDEEFQKWTNENASQGGELLFGRKTYEMMASWWPSEQAKQTMPEVAKGMNEMQKTVFSSTLQNPVWENSRVISGNLVDEVRKLKEQDAPGICIMGSGQLIAGLASSGLIDEYLIVVVPVILGAGRTMFEGTDKLSLGTSETKVFKNGNVFLRYKTENYKD